VRLAGAIGCIALFGAVAVVAGLGIDELRQVVQAKTAGSNLAGKAVIAFVAIISLLMLAVTVWLTMQFADQHSGRIFVWLGFAVLSAFWMWKSRPTAVCVLFSFMAVLLTGSQCVNVIGWLRCLALPRGASGKPLLAAACTGFSLAAMFSIGTLYLGGTHFTELVRPAQIGRFVAASALAYACGCTAQLICALFVRGLGIALGVDRFHQRMTRHAVIHTAVSLAGFLFGYWMLKGTLAGWPAGLTALCVLTMASFNNAHFVDSLDRCLEASST
jgi:hypothetical protein